MNDATGNRASFFTTAGSERVPLRAQRDSRNERGCFVLMARAIRPGTFGLRLRILYPAHASLHPLSQPLHHLFVEALILWLRVAEIEKTKETTHDQCVKGVAKTDHCLPGGFIKSPV